MAEEKSIQPQEKQEMQFREERTRDRRCFVPRTDIYETDDAIHLTLDMPGVTESSVEVSMEKNVLSVNGWVEPFSYEGFTPAFTEYQTGDYQRSFTVQTPIEVDAIEAGLKNGVLSIKLPKQASSRTKKVEIKTL